MASGCRCINCGKENERLFYKAKSNLLATPSGLLPVCKECVGKQYDLYMKMYHSSRRAIQRLCMAYDIYYSDDLYRKCTEIDGVVQFGEYLQKTCLKIYAGRSFDNSLAEGFRFTSDINGIDVGLEEDDTKQTIERRWVEQWGSGFEYEDYIVLNDHYEKLRQANKDKKNSANNQEVFIESLCKLNMLMTRAIKSGDLDGYAKANDQYIKTFTKAGLKAVQEIEMGADDCWGEWTRRIEQYTPAEYYKNKALFRDFDGVGDYFTRFVLRPLKNLMHGTTDRDPEYSVEDGDDDGSEPTT